MNLTDIAVIEDTYQHLRDTGAQYQKKTIENLLAFSIVAYTLQQKCKEEEKDFAALALEYWSLSPSGASQAAKVGAKAAKFEEHSQALPASARALYELATLPEKQFAEYIEQGHITPNLSVVEAKALKDMLKDKKNKTEEVAGSNPFEVQKQDEVEILPQDEKSELHPEVLPKIKLSVVAALDLLDINVLSYYEDAKKAGLHEIDLLDEAFTLLTKEKKKKVQKATLPQKEVI